MEQIINEPIERDMKNSYLDYAMSVIVGRALPDVRDGLKPVHRRILYTMYKAANLHNKPYKKSARIVGDVLGRYHPHGDSAIYDSLVRMAQDFSLRYILVDGQGNFGSIDGDSAAAMRYTEVKMKLISEEMLADIEKQTVDFTPNFDATLQEPIVLPSKVPNLLMNGSSGIAVGMATNIPPHNSGEIIDALIALIDGEEKSNVIAKVKGPDFPTGGIIVGRNGIFQAYATGKGRVKVRARCEIDEDKNSIIVTEIPYQVTKTNIIERIVDGVKDGRIKGIRGVHDHSDKDGISVVIELKRGENPEVVLNQLYKHSPLESTFGIINLVLVNNQPKLLDLYSILNEFIKFRKEIVTRRSQFELKQAEDRAHILEGLKKALENIDNIVDLLKSAKDPADALNSLMEKYSLSEVQSKAILDMKLSKLISMEQEKLRTEYGELQKKITELKDILADVSKVLAIIREELMDVRARYGDNRKTEIIDDEEEIDIEELIPNDEVVLMITNRGYVKRVDLGEYKAQRRGGKGVIGIETKEEDAIDDILITRNHNTLLCFTNKGRVHWLKAYRIPQAGRYSTGKAIVNLLNLPDKEEKVTSWIPVKEFNEEEYLSMVTKKGIVKRTSLKNFSRPRNGGIIAINLREEDELESVLKTDGKQSILIATKNGLSIRFKEEDARELGRTGMGVIGIRMRNDDQVVSAAICNKPALLTITENGFGKRTSIEEYRIQGRGGHGIINIKTEGRNGKVARAKAVNEDDQIMVVSSKGQVIRVPVANISVIGRNTSGVRIIRLKDGEKVANFAVIKAEFLEDNP